MKKLFFSLILVILGTVSGFAVIDTYSISRNDLPEDARDMLNDYFPRAKVSMVKVDRHLFKNPNYVVKLLNGTKIEFNDKGKWTLVDCGSKALPATLMPAAIRRYVDKNYPKTKMVKAERGNTQTDVTLSDGVVLRFGVLGNFKEVVSTGGAPRLE